MAHDAADVTYAACMTTRVPVRQLQRHASQLIDRVQAGETVEITRNGRLVAVLTAPDDRDQVLQELIDEGYLDPEELRTKPGLANVEPLDVELPVPLSQVLTEMREEERW